MKPVVTTGQESQPREAKNAMNQISELLNEDRQHDSIRRLAHHFDLERRDFLKLLGGGVLVGLCPSSAGQESGGPRHQTSEDIPNSLLSRPGFTLVKTMPSLSTPARLKSARTFAHHWRSRWQRNCAFRSLRFN